MTFRYDIQALRGFAVLIILFYHAGIGPFTAGYLGVDVFFVISGFLITSLIIKDLRKEAFSFKAFYFRRAKRLLPAALTVLFLTTVASLFFLTPGQYRDYKNQLVGALSFTANFALYDQTDYFASDAKTQPLLHTWSLSIEEQFYLVLPLLLFFTPQRRWGKMVPALFLASLLWCLWCVRLNPDQAFFFLPSRAWELLVGSLLAIYPLKKDLGILQRPLFYISLLVLAVMPVLPVSMAHPGWGALLVCFATAFIIQHYSFYPMQQSMPRVVKGMAVVGDYSYALYLVHWPLFAFATNAVLTGEVPLLWRAALLGASLLGAYLLHHLVEKPVHKAEFPVRKKLVGTLLAASVLVAGMGVGIQTMYKKSAGHNMLLKPNVGLGRACDHKDNFKGDPKDRYKVLPQCQTSDHPDILIWGDSYAMSWIPGLAETSERGIVQATRRACSPLTTASYAHPPKYTKQWAQRCIGFNRDVLDALDQYPSVEIIVLSSAFERVSSWEYLGQRWEDGRFVDAVMGVDTAVRAMRETVQEIRARGKKVVVISPPPKNKLNVGRCLEKLKLQKVIFGNENSCRLSRAKMEAQYKDVYSFLRRLPAEADVEVIEMADHLCTDGACAAQINDTILYIDDGHITVEGSVEIARAIDLLGLVKAKAR